MRKTNISNANNQDTLHDTAFTSDVMNVMNTDMSSWNVITEYPLQEQWHHTTRHTEIATTDPALNATGKTKEEETSPDHSLDTVNTVAPAIMTCIEAAPDHNTRTCTAILEAAQDDPIQHIKDTVTGLAMIQHTCHTANPPHTTVHQATTHRTAADHTCDHPTDCQSIVHTRKNHSLGSYSNQGNQWSHLRRNMKDKIEEQPSDYYSSDDHSTDLGEERSL